MLKNYNENSFDPILSFGFSLSCLKMYMYYVKDHQKDSYNKRNFIDKNTYDKNILATLKKIHILKM
jgi:hypothetical protein